MRIGIDLDRVLFDTDSFDDFYKEKVEGLYHVDEPAPVKHGCYDPEMHASLCGIPKDRIWKVFENDLSQFLYSDVDLLNELNQHKLVLVTRGHEKFQRKKAEASGVSKIFDEIHVVQEESKDSIDIDILADDSNEELENISIPGIKINRPEEGIEKIIKKVENIEA